MIYGPFTFLRALVRRMYALLSATLAVALAAAPVAALAQPDADSTTDTQIETAMSAGNGALDCMTRAIVYEAGFEPVEGQQAVAQVILNRLKLGTYPKTVCGVIYQGSERRTGCQFTFTCDGSLRRKVSDRVYLAARGVAQSALEGTLPDRVGSATHYHAYYVSPYWASSLARIGRIGAHIFYGGDRRTRQKNRLDSGGLGVTLALSSQAGPRANPARPFSPWGLPLIRSMDTVAVGPAAD